MDYRGNRVLRSGETASMLGIHDLWLLSARTASRFRRSGRAMRWINRALGSMFVYIAARMAMLQARVSL